MEEVWKDIDGFSNYQVSNKGKVRSRMPTGFCKGPKDKYLILKQQVNHGYSHVMLYKNKKQHYKKVHRLVSSAFIPNADKKPLVNHRDGDKLNNCVSNLEWCTHSENMKHAFRTGLQDINGENHPSTSLTENDVIQMRNTYRLGCFTHKDIAGAWGISRRTVGAIINRRTWTHI